VEGRGREIIDGSGPDGISQVTVDVAPPRRQAQTGYVYHYAFAMMIGVVALVSWYLVAFRAEDPMPISRSSPRSPPSCPWSARC
jgi:hypothetical protein